MSNQYQSLNYPQYPPNPYSYPPSYPPPPPPSSYPPLSNSPPPFYPPYPDQGMANPPVMGVPIYNVGGERILGRAPTRTFCPFCSVEVTTTVMYEAGDKTNCMACLLCLIGGVICCLIPYCIDDCQDAVHFCPNCRNVLGKQRF